jgi:hypothetical protein
MACSGSSSNKAGRDSADDDQDAYDVGRDDVQDGHDVDDGGESPEIIVTPVASPMASSIASFAASC